jgi:hypothetical protein
MPMAEKRPKMKQPLQLAALLEAVFAGKPAERRMRESKVWQVWAEAVGAQVAGKSQPASFRDGTLTVRVSGSAWLQQLSLMKQDIIHHLNEAVGAPLVTDIFFKQGSLSIHPEKSAEVPPKRKLSEAEKRQLAELAAPVADPELREALLALFTSQLADARRTANLLPAAAAAPQEKPSSP